MSEHVELPGGAWAWLYEGPEDAMALAGWASDNPTMAVDTETTGLDLYAGDVVTLVILANATEAWVVPLDSSSRRELGEALDAADHLIFHNAAFDLTALGDLVSDGWSRVIDTQIMSHLVDSRPKVAGGVGHGLKALAVAHVGAEWGEPEDERKKWFRENKWSESAGWKMADPRSNEMVRYAGADGVMTFLLHDALELKLQQLGGRTFELLGFERDVAATCWAMQERGLLIDTDTGLRIDATLKLDERLAVNAARLLGVENVNATSQVAEALVAAGAVLPDLTPSGKSKVDKTVLRAISEGGGPGAGIASAVLTAKRSAKFRTVYVESVLDSLDADGRCHPQIRTLAAITGRMSISNPPLQQLPAGDRTIRDMFIANPGMTLVAVDYSQIELRVLAALAGEDQMIEAIKRGDDLHSITSIAVFGDAEPAHRKLAKIIGLGKVYGGGVATLARQAQANEGLVRTAVMRYDDEFPKLKQFNRKMQTIAERSGIVTTITDRRIKIDTPYRAVNYAVQSAARDIFAKALVELGKCDDFEMLIPIHDEILVQCPTAQAELVKDHVVEVMTTELKGVPIMAEGKVVGERWGSAYE